MNKQKINKEKTWTSFTDLAMDWGCQPYLKELKNPQKLNNVRMKFFNKHICKGCGHPMIWEEGTNIVVCSNPKCKGIEKKNKDDTVSYFPSYEVLDNKGASIARSIKADSISNKELQNILNKKEADNNAV